jgi:hypothetical protein
MLVQVIEEHRLLNAFEYKVMKRIYGTKKEDVTGGRRTLYNELHNL